MKSSGSLSPQGSERLYEEAKQLFLQGRHEEAFAQFKRLYQTDVLCRDVVDIVHDYYDLPKDEWLAKYETKFVGPDGVA